MRIRVLIVDDHPIVRHGLNTFLGLDPEIQVVGEAADGEQAIRLVGALRPDVVVMDLLMPGMGGIEATGLIHSQYPEVKVLVLTSANQDALVLQAMAAGAAGYLPKDTEIHELRPAIHTVGSGQTYVSPTLAGRVISQLGGVAKGSSLTEREAEILELLAKGATNKEIAASLQIGVPTVKTHVSTILSKLGVTSRTQAALQANLIAVR